MSFQPGSTISFIDEETYGENPIEATYLMEIGYMPGFHRIKVEGEEAARVLHTRQITFVASPAAAGAAMKADGGRRKRKSKRRKSKRRKSKRRKSKRRKSKRRKSKKKTSLKITNLKIQTQNNKD